MEGAMVGADYKNLKHIRGVDVDQCIDQSTNIYPIANGQRKSRIKKIIADRLSDCVIEDATVYCAFVDRHSGEVLCHAVIEDGVPRVAWCGE
jgi:hypothetical protein